MTATQTIIGVFSDVTKAKLATDELHEHGIPMARLVEHDRLATFEGTADAAEIEADEPDQPDRHLIIIEECNHVDRSIQIIRSFGGTVETKDASDDEPRGQVTPQPQPGL